MGGVTDSVEVRAQGTEGEAERRTYLYLRVSLVGTVVLLGAALVWELARTDWVFRNSISQYYYSPVMSVFVASVVGMGFALIALAGRPGPEEVALNLAGMLAPIVAFVPTPVEGTAEAPCDGGAAKCVPAEFVPNVINNVSALLVVGLLAIIFAAFSARELVRTDPWVRWGLVSAGLVWIGVAAWFGFSADWPPNESFLRYGHYSAAIPMFALIIFVVLHNGWLSRKELVIAGKPVSYRPIYRWIGFLMALTVAVGVVWWLVTRADEDAPHVIFGVEAVLLGFFMVFWAMQTLEFRRSGLPPEARSTSD